MCLTVQMDDAWIRGGPRTIRESVSLSMASKSITAITDYATGLLLILE